MSELGERVAAIEAQFSASEKSRESFRLEQREDFQRVFAALEEIRVKLAAIPPACSAPNMCHDLKVGLENSDRRVEKIQLFIEQQKGGWKVMSAMVGLAGACGAAADWLFKKAWP